MVILYILVPARAHIIRDSRFNLFTSFFVRSTCAPLNKLAQRTDGATTTAVSFWLSYADGLGRAALGTGARRGDYTLCTHGGILQRTSGPVACSVQFHAAFSSRSCLPQIGVLAQWRGPQKSNYGPFDVSFRTGIFLQDQGPFQIIYSGVLFIIEKSNFDTRANHQVSW